MTRNKPFLLISIWIIGIIVSAECSNIVSQRDCSRLRFNKHAKRLQFYPGCEQWSGNTFAAVNPIPLNGMHLLLNTEKITKSMSQPNCLFFDDATMANLMFLGPVIFPVYENTLNPNNPKDGEEVLENAYIIYDEYSSMHALGVGKYFGPKSIGNYRAVPHSKVSGVVQYSMVGIDDIISTPSTSEIKIAYFLSEQWKHLNLSEGVVSKWKMRRLHYPCSAIIKSELVQVSEASLKGFSDAGKGMENKVCEEIMKNCVGHNKQFAEFSSCLTYMKGLPHHDKKCIKKYRGPYPAKGNAFMCKLLHSFMTKNVPEKHCFHAATGKPDVEGHVKCWETDCLDEIRSNNLDKNDENRQMNIESNFTVYSYPAVRKKETVCTEEELDEVTSAAVLATFYCLPSLNSDTCMDKCRQAINTFLGRFVNNDLVCKCKDKTLPSKLLSLLEIDLFTLLRICSGKTLAEYPTCFKHLPFAKKNCLGDPNTYQSLSGCSQWNWDKLESGMLSDWDEFSQWSGRTTKSVKVASAECYTLSNLLSLRNGYENAGHFDKYVGDRFQKEYIFIHPTDKTSSKWVYGKDNVFKVVESTNTTVDKRLGQLISSYKQVSGALQNDASFQKDETSLTSSACIFGTWKELIHDDSPVFQNVDSEKYLAGKTFFERLTPNILSKISFSQLHSKYGDWFLNTASAVNGIKEEYTKRRGRIIDAGISRMRFGISRETLSKTWDDQVADLTKSSRVAFWNEDFHRIHGYSLALGYLQQTLNFMKTLQRIYSPKEMYGHIKESGLNIGVKDGYQLLATSLSSNADLCTVAKLMVDKVHQDPCKFLPFWYGETNDKSKFVLEFLRLYSSPSGFRRRKAISNYLEQSNYYSLSAANLDETVFEHPQEFNPNRLDLNKTLLFNRLMGETMENNRDGVLGYDFTTKALVATALHSFPNKTALKKCHGPQKVIDGTNVKFTSTVEKVSGRSESIEMYKYEPNTSHHTELFIALHGFPDMPKIWSKIFDYLQKHPEFENFDFWAPSLPGWGMSSKIECKISTASNIMASSIMQTIDNGKYKKIYLMGHDLGALLMWKVADILTNKLTPEIAEKIKGLIVLSSAHPLSQLYPITKIPTSELFFRPLLSDMNDAYLGVEDFAFFTDVFRSMTWWNIEWENEYKLFWQKTGISALKCYFKDNFEPQATGFLKIKEQFLLKSINPTTNILMIGAEHDSITKDEQYKHTLSLLLAKTRGKDVDYIQIKGADRYALIINDFIIQKVVQKITNFLRKINNHHFGEDK